MVKPMETIPEGVKHIHCIGIGGSGMFPLVQILHGRGYTITGSDNNESDIVNLERQMGIEVMMVHFYLYIHITNSFIIIYNPIFSINLSISPSPFMERGWPT